MPAESKVKKAGFTLIELQVAMVALLILWSMIAGIEYFLIQSTIQVVKTQDPETILASVFGHMERNISSGIYWRRYVNDVGTITDIEIYKPDSADYPEYLVRSQDKRMWYRFDMSDMEAPSQGIIYFYPDVPSDVTEAERWTYEAGRESLLGGIVSAYISDVDANAKEVYIQLENAPFPVLKYKTKGMIFGRTFRLRALW